ncbi:MAG: hypothetical protein HGA53_03235 [Anaerolineaceae bacterium]|nr:hypothetical protein [Anaerolineaceae bacterium]NTV35944.1 hypothetical protein [Anaerolineaceae bacterium]
MNKLNKIGLRISIAITSIVAFLSSWVIFANSSKPEPLIVTPPIAPPANVDPVDVPALAPIPTLVPIIQVSLPTLQPVQVASSSGGTSASSSPAAAAPKPKTTKPKKPAPPPPASKGS